MTRLSRISSAISAIVHGPNWPWIYAALCCAAMVVFFRTAWITDDAFITLRSVLNVVHGFGPVYNLGERVQAYTHPAWFGLLTGATALLGNPFLATYAVSFTVSGLLLLALGRLLRQGAIIVVLLMILSKGVVDFLNSGLENGLSFLLIALTAGTLVRTDLRWRWGLCGLCCGTLIMTRPDLGLMLVAVLALNRSATAWRGVALGLLPLILWLGFSLFYYGALFPNTTLAKLGTGVPKLGLLEQGLTFLYNVILHDPVSMLTVLVFFTCARNRPAIRELALFAGLYILYILWIGGDFMGTRFFTIPFMAAAIGLGLLWKDGALPRLVPRGLVLAMLLLSPVTLPPNVLAGARFHDQTFWSGDIADERGFYFQRFGLVVTGLENFPDVSDWEDRAAEDRAVQQICGGLGGAGLRRGPATHMLDVCALVDPLLARLPWDARPPDYWRIGHLDRQPPTDYAALLMGEIDTLPHGPTQRLNSDIELALRGPLTAPGRAAAIWRLNTADYGLDEFYAFQDVPETSD